VLGALAVALECRAVVALQWHYPSDALGGAAFGVGMVLLVDGVLHLLGPAAARLWGSGPR
jgi:membrane-associated phospholipid phosphatase